jgi:hypothetical protein
MIHDQKKVQVASVFNHLLRHIGGNSDPIVRVQFLIRWLKTFWRRHIVDDFPWPDECFDCNRLDCEGCHVKD